MHEQYEVVSGSAHIPIAVHRCTGTSTIVINYPGYRGSIDGYEQKYVKLAEHLVGHGLGTVVRMANTHYQDEEYKVTVQRDLCAVIDYVLAHAGESDPDIYLIGTSAGGGAVAAIASRYPSVKKILLVAPSFDVARDDVVRCVERFTGEVSIVVGMVDDVTGVGPAAMIHAAAANASARNIALIPDCDHHFSGVTNGRILSQAPLWAFDEMVDFPSPNGGIELYV